jgi:cAMP-dependent protein kinase regulator
VERLDHVQARAAALYARGDAGAALRLYDAIVAAAPLHYEARMRVGDCLAALGEPAAAAAVHRAVARYAIDAGHPLAALVLARVLAAAGREADDLVAAVVFRYGRDSGLLGRMAARIALPGPELELSPPDLVEPAPPALIATAAERAERCVDGFASYPEALHPIPLLSQLSEEAFRRVVATLLVRRLPDGAQVIRAGEPGESFFFVAGGMVRVYDLDGLGTARELARLGENAVFGEMALLSAEPRSASVDTVGEVDLLEATRASLAALAGELAPVAEALHRFTRDRLLNNLMATSPLFAPFSRPQRLELLQRFTAHDVAPGTPIIHEGDEATGLFVVLAGEVEVAKLARDGSRSLATLRTRAVFGEVALLRGGPTTATVTATRPGTVLFLGREYVDRLVAGVPAIRRYLDDLAEERELDTARVLSPEPGLEERPADDDQRVLI